MPMEEQDCDAQTTRNENAMGTFIYSITPYPSTVMVETVGE
jgi:hypothetical protein